MSHRVTVRNLSTHLPGQDQPMGQHGPSALEHLSACIGAHQAALGINVIDVVRDAAGLRCAECRRVFSVDVSMFETHQR